ncbi:hypothetical protein ACFQGR_01385 [Weissella sagaensis]|uniref:Phage protein n=1 Tax=Weissella sagaensis TaxID=2559928 RepID=A0ABW1RRL8_9LACO|nr:hypothetical protein [Weissella sagaensis]
MDELQAIDTHVATIVTTDGEMVPVTQLTVKDFENMDDRTLEEVNYLFKIADKAKKVAKKEIDKRLEAGHTFSRYVHKNRKSDEFDADNNDFKAQMIYKYGYDAVLVKSPAKLKEKFGDVINGDVEPHIVHGTKPYATWE